MLVAGATIGISLAAVDVRPWVLVATEAVLAAAVPLAAETLRDASNPASSASPEHSRVSVAPP